MKGFDYKANKGKFILLSGPCVIESEEMCLSIARKIKKIAVELKVPFVFKASYDKGNRTAVENYRGPGLTEGLRILKKVKEEVGVPILTDVHCCSEVDAVAEVADIIQIPAYLCQQTTLTLKVANTGRVVNIKKAQFLSPWDMKKIITKVESTGNKKIILTERGSIFGYSTLITDMRAFTIMKEYGYPVIFDVTHAVRVPGFTSKDKRGGTPEMIMPMALAGIAAGSAGLFVETHPDCKNALCDASSMLPLSKLKTLLVKAKKTYDVVRG
ncbi:MAG: 3-deoxy-8-phosphooctulonate synthase [Candidatus Firestonebacteria bacterium GWA2_43_8]|nr:MAG: 3-deoxy-8-phosphooctulonate synthase [Candidatus Firestonebacteria bacterium GWA2_43_8]